MEVNPDQSGLLVVVVAMVVRRRAPHNGWGGDGFSGCRLNDRSTVVRSRCPGTVRGGLYFCLSTIKPQSSTGAVNCGRGRLRWRAVYKGSHHPPPTYTEVEVGGAQPERLSLCGKMLRTPVGWPQFPRAAHICDFVACLKRETPTRPFSNFLDLIPIQYTSRLKIYQIEILMKNLNQSKIQSCL